MSSTLYENCGHVTRDASPNPRAILIEAHVRVYTRNVKDKKVISLALAISIAAIVVASAQEVAAPRACSYGGYGAVLLRGPWERQDGASLPLPEASGKDVALPGTPKRPDFAALSTEPTIYRAAVRVVAGDPERRLGVFMPASARVSAVYANGELIYDTGRGPSTPPLLLAEAPAGTLSLALRLDAGSRPLEAPSSFPPFVLFGDAESVSRAAAALGTATVTLDGYFVLLSLFSLCLFLFWKKSRDSLAFSAFLLAEGLYYVLVHGSIFFRLGSPPDELETVRLGLESLRALALAFLFAGLYASRVRGRRALAVYALPAAMALGAGLVLVLQRAGVPMAPALPILYAAVEGGAVLFVVASLAGLGILLARGERKARWLAPALLALAGGRAAGAFWAPSPLAAYALPAAGSIAFSATVFLMLTKKVADTFESSEGLSDYVASVSKAVKSFIPKEFLENLQKTDLVDLRLGDHTKKEMTIFFSDLRAFTQLSEALTVEENFAFINSYLSRVVPIIKENGGFVDKYVGDGIMALFPGPHGPDEAIRSAIAMQVKMVEYNGHRAKMGYRPISMGVGVHTGDLMLGVVGVEERMENTVISDAVNLSSRLQSITKAFNIGLAISEKAFKELEDPGVYKYRFIGKVKVKGKAAPVSVFEIFDGIEPGLFDRKMRANMFFEQGMLSYYQKDFAGATYYFKTVLEIIPEDGAAGFYLDNCLNKATV